MLSGDRSAAFSTSASAIGSPRLGESVPLVTSPTMRPPALTGQCCRGTPLSRSLRPQSVLAAPRSLSGRITSLPMNAFFDETTQPRPASIGLTARVSSWP